MHNSVRSMLRIWLSTDRKKNTQRIFDEICRKKQENQILLVPEQFSHMAERQLCKLGGDSINRYAEVLSFSRLANRVFAVVGGSALTQTDAAGKLLIMSLAVEQVRSRLKLYGASGEKPAFLLKIIETIEELQSFCISPQSLREASVNLSGVLAVKAEELALLIESYESVCTNLGQNPESCLTRLLHCLDGSDFAQGLQIYIDGFTDFNGVEREIIAQLLNGGAGVTVALHCDDIHAYSQQFSAARTAAKELLQIASRQSLEIEVSKLEEINDHPCAVLKNKLFGGDNTPYPIQTDGIVFIEATTPTAECRIAAGEILRLVESGARFRDITVACGDYTQYRNILQSIFNRARIPAYYAGDTDILRQSVIHMLLSALDAATGGMETETVLSYLKSGFLSIPRQRWDRLEKYVLMWNLQGRQWETEWTKNPFGFVKKENSQSKKILAQLNQDREAYVMPLLLLQMELRSAGNTGQMLLAFNRFMERIRLNEQLNAMSQMLSEQNELQTAQEYAQVYAIVCALLEQMYGVLANTVRSPEASYQLFKSALSQCSVGTIPATLDGVNVGNLLSQRRSDCKYLFLLGANEGAFPSAQSNQTLLTDIDRVSLMQLGIGITPLTTCGIERELAAIAAVLQAPTERLYLGGVRGQESYYLLRAKKLFDQAKKLTEDHDLIVRSERDYLNYLLTKSEYVDKASNRKEEAMQLLSAKKHEIGSLSADTVKALYGQELQLSSSKIDKLAMCRLGFFLQYGLNAQERKPAQMDASVFGTFVHDILEHVSKQIMQEGGFRTVPLERALKITHERMQWYMQEKLADLWDSERSEYLFRRSFEEVFEVVRQLWREMSVSRFDPKWFELKFGKGELMPSVRIVGQSMTAELSGVVDRADIWRCDDKIYVRIVDYKTGKTTFELNKILQGIGLQMLLYLFAMRRSGEHLMGSPLECAGVLYFPAKVSRLSIDKFDTKIDEKRQKAERRSGMILEQEQILQAMDPQEIFLPEKNSRASKEQFRDLESFVFRKVAQFTDELAEGRVDANPYYIGDRDNACAKCSYCEICQDTAEKRWIPSVKEIDAFWQKVKEVEIDG